MAIIVIEIPHEMPPRCWFRYDEQEIINVCMESTMIYQKYTLESAGGAYGDDIPEDWLEVLRAHKEGVEFGTVNQTQFVPAGEAPSEYEVACDVISDDLYFCSLMTIDEAREFINDYRGHQMFKAKNAVKRVLATLGSP